MTAFTGFPPDAMSFFVELADNQNREWMAANKARYDSQVRAPLSALVLELSNRFEASGVPLSGDPKQSLFRLNRDVRFSTDKRPYNDHASAALTRYGDKRSAGVLYMQFSPDASFVAAGFFRPEPATLNRLREGIVARPEAWFDIKSGLARANLELMRDDTLVRTPRGFEDAPDSIIEDLKLKSWTTSRPITSAEQTSEALIDLVDNFACSAMPLVNFGWAALAELEDR